MPASRLNWEAIKAEYISGEDSVTHQALADKYRCNRCTVSKHAMGEGWDDARKQYRNTVATKTLNRASTTEAEMRARQIRQAQYLQTKALTAMKTCDPQDFPQALRALEVGLEQERKAAGIVDGTGAQLGISVTFASEPGQPDD